MNKLSVLLIIFTVSFTVAAEQGSSIMFEQNDKNSHLVTMPEKKDTRTEKCKALADKVKQYKGKPQRRYAAQQQYEAECLNSAE
jgi:hypothetical protein